MRLDSLKLARNVVKKGDDILKEYGFTVGNRILSYEYWIGMTGKQAVLSLGVPASVNKTVGSYGVHEQWVYSEKYLYFENGILTSFQLTQK